MAFIAIQGDGVSVAGYQPDPALITSTQFFVTINNQPMLKQGDIVAPHTLVAPPNTVHAGATMNSSQSTVTINGVPVVQVGDVATCDPSHAILSSQNSFVSIS